MVSIWPLEKRAWLLGNVHVRGAASVAAAKRVEMMIEARILMGWVGLFGLDIGEVVLGMCFAKGRRNECVSFK